MSYDLEVWARRFLPDHELQELVEQAGLTWVGNGTVARGRRGGYCFHLDRAAVEEEDVPEEVVGAVLAPTTRYGVCVEGTVASEIPHAVTFARRLARTVEGALHDPQEGTVLAGGRLREAPRMERGRIDVVDVHWYLTNGDRRVDATAWLEAARRHLPEALPRRYGAYEPLPATYEPHDPDAFVDAVATAGSNVYLAGTRPVLGGHLGSSDERWPVTTHGLTLDRAALHDPGWRSSFRRFFVAVAEATGALYAVAEVQRDVSWSGRSLGYDGEVEPTAYLAMGGEWKGLPPYPVWWSWLGPEYLALVGGEPFRAAAEAPADRDALAGAPGLPPELRANNRTVEGARQVLCEPADVLPRLSDGRQA